MLEDGEERPADVFVQLPDGDTAIDVTVRDNLAVGDSVDVKRRRRWAVGVVAAIGEREKRGRRGGQRGLTMEERLAERNIAFMPVAFEVGGAETGAWS